MQPLLSEDILQFCFTINPQSAPQTIPHRPALGNKTKQCYNIVPKHIRSHGGIQIFGWAIRKWPNVWLEAEHHVVWQSPEGRLIDVTPRNPIPHQIIFLADPKAERKTPPVNSIRHLLGDDPAIHDLSEALTRHTYEIAEFDPTDKQRAGIIAERILNDRQIMQKMHKALVLRYGNPIW